MAVPQAAVTEAVAKMAVKERDVRDAALENAFGSVDRMFRATPAAAEAGRGTASVSRLADMTMVSPRKTPVWAR